MTFQKLPDGTNPEEFEHCLRVFFNDVHTQLKTELTGDEWVELYKRMQYDPTSLEMFLCLFKRRVYPYLAKHHQDSLKNIGL